MRLNSGLLNWYYDDNNYPHIVRVRQGEIKSRLNAHRTDKRFIDYYLNKCRILYVTWAMVWLSDRDGVEAFLGRELGERYPDAKPIEVNLPPLSLAWNYAHDLLKSYRSQANPFTQQLLLCKDNKTRRRGVITIPCFEI